MISHVTVSCSLLAEFLTNFIIIGVCLDVSPSPHQLVSTNRGISTLTLFFSCHAGYFSKPMLDIHIMATLAGSIYKHTGPFS